MLTFQIDGVVAIRISSVSDEIALCSAYSSPNADIDFVLAELGQLIQNMGSTEIFFGSDLNGHSPFWGCRDQESRGSKILDFLIFNYLFLVNDPKLPPTYVLGTRKGWPDLSFVNSSQLVDNAFWKVDFSYSASSHKYI